MDTTAAEAVKDWREGYERTGVHLALIDPNPQITMMLQKTGMLDSGDSCSIILDM
jgi:anti-anti-sigma regulatory factor